MDSAELSGSSEQFDIDQTLGGELMHDEANNEELLYDVGSGEELLLDSAETEQLLDIIAKRKPYGKTMMTMQDVPETKVGVSTTRVMKTSTTTKKA